MIRPTIRFASSLALLPIAVLISLAACRPAPPAARESKPPETSATPAPTPQNPTPAPPATPTPAPTPQVPPKAEKLEISTQPLQAIAGRSFDPAPAARVTDSAGRPVAGALVTVAISKNTFTDSSQKQAATDAEGLAVFSDLAVEKADSSYRLAFSAEGCAPLESAEFNVRFAPPRAMAVAVQPSASRTGKPIAGPPAVRLVDSFGNPVPRIAVEARLQEPAKGVLSGTVRVTTNENGEAVFEKLVPKSAAAKAILSFDAKAAGVPDAVSETFRIR